MTAELHLSEGSFYRWGDRSHMRDSSYLQLQGLVQLVDCDSRPSDFKPSSHIRRSHKHGLQATWESDHKTRFKNAPICLLFLYKGRVFMENHLLKNYFFNHPHLFVEKHSSMINNGIKTLEQTRVLCLGFFCCTQSIFILATLVYCVV